MDENENVLEKNTNQNNIIKEELGIKETNILFDIIKTIPKYKTLIC